VERPHRDAGQRSPVARGGLSCANQTRAACRDERFGECGTRDPPCRSPMSALHHPRQCATGAARSGPARALPGITSQYCCSTRCWHRRSCSRSCRCR
jgi:hypothetical protein